MTTTAIAVHGSRAFTQRDKNRFIRLVAKGMNKPAAAERVGFSYGTVKKHLKADVEFFDAVREAEDELIDKVESVPVELALKGNLGAAIFVLTNKRPKNWRDAKVIRNEHSGPDGGPIQIVQATTIALKEVLSAPETRDAAIRMVRSIPVAGRAALPAGEDGVAAAFLGGVSREPGRDPAGAEAPRLPE